MSWKLPAAIIVMSLALTTYLVVLAARQPETPESPYEEVAKFRVRGCASYARLLRFEDRGTVLYVVHSCRGTSLWGE